MLLPTRTDGEDAGPEALVDEHVCERMRVCADGSAQRRCISDGQYQFLVGKEVNRSCCVACASSLAWAI